MEQYMWVAWGLIIALQFRNIANDFQKKNMGFLTGISFVFMVLSFYFFFKELGKF